MRFSKFENIVKLYCENVESVSQKSATQDGAVLVVFKGSRKAYLFKGTYFEILGKLGVNYICTSTVDLYKKELNKLNSVLTGKASYSLFDKEHEKERARARVDNIYKEVASYKGCLLISEDGDILGTFTGMI